ncbi:MAG: discoidin domain-containing protein, partial [Crenarchaeota archaeon]|nr:discoidin domain-containing protein [Thermoproteota archaeon]
MLKEPIFGEWLTLCTKGIGLRLVIEEMNGASAAPSVANAKLTTRPDEVPKLFFSSGTPSWPWRGTADDHAPTITWRFSRETEFLSLKVEQTGETEWIRRYRLEVTRDGQVWRVITPSRLIDAYHRQPCVLRNQLETLESCLLPAGRGTQWVQSFWEDFMLRTIEPLGLDSPYPEWLPGRYFIAAAVR